MTDPERRVAAIVAEREAAARAARLRRRRDRSLWGHVLVLVLLVAAVVAVTATRRIDDPARAPAERVAAEIDAAYAAWVTGALELGAEPAPVGTSLTGAVVRRFGEPLYVVTGEAAGSCYGASWDARGYRQARVLADGLPCRPSPLVASSQPQHFLRVAEVVRDPEEPYPWDRVLPPPQRDRYLFYPSVAVLGTLALATATRVVTILITGLPAGDVPRRRRR